MSPEPSINLKPSSPDALRLSELLADLILQNNPRNTSVNNGKRAASIQRWASDIDKLIRIDGQPPSIVERVIQWSQTDEFWRSNVLSGSTLRKQWDKLTAKMPRYSHQSATTPPRRRLEVAL
jgi:hypothetical protein